ncbi:hypothetical protein SAMN05660297_02774 [Natronincola peptidivorans]|uniref:Uncharacterized protein n=1 Tax=Natronincola peptidivorans TaxID=426128 RepID=A0A1I0FD94_9FIRM|nr:hypothetical protein [Natronincola peptidivorans]SET56241.1 hypothetical protein SAMN05660297_02774 [Natronincola peptidivorans]
MTVELADKLYREHGLISICNDGKFIDFANYLEKEKPLPPASK